MASEDNDILEFNQESTFIIYADFQYIIKKIDGCKDNPEKSSTANIKEHMPSGFSIYTISSFRSTRNKNDVYRGKDYMKKFCEFLREHAMKIINFKKKKIEVINRRAAGIM